ncbi:DUF4332 domain-containing protein [Streptomyces sp. NPDC059718]
MNEDELTRIDGVGATTARLLAAAGIRTYAELSAASTDEVIAAVRDLRVVSAIRVEQWRKDAAELDSAVPPPGPAPAESADTGYESFVLRVRLDRGRIRATEIRRVRTGETRHWPEWDAGALLACVLGRPADPGPGPGSVPDPDPVPDPVPVPGPGLATGTGGGNDGDPRAGVATPVTLLAEPLLAVAGGAVRPGVPFTLDVTLALPRATGSGACFAYYAAVTVSPGVAGRRVLADDRGVLRTGDPVVRLSLPGLPPGTHRLGIAVSLREPGGHRPSALAATVEGIVLTV